MNLYETLYRVASVTEDTVVNNTHIYTFVPVRISPTKGPSMDPVVLRDEPGVYQMGQVYRMEKTIWPVGTQRPPSSTNIGNATGVQIGNGNNQSNVWS